MSILYGFLALTLGVVAFAFGNPAGVPIFGLAFAGAGFLREFRGPKRMPILLFLVVGSGICVFGTLRSFHYV